MYQRNDLIDPKRMDITGATNLQLMRNGKAPIDKSNKQIELHHMLQNQTGPIAEVTKKFHTEYYKVIHINPNKVPSGIDREVFKKWKKNYWKMRAKDFE